MDEAIPPPAAPEPAAAAPAPPAPPEALRAGETVGIGCAALVVASFVAGLVSILGLVVVLGLGSIGRIGESSHGVEGASSQAREMLSSGLDSTGFLISLGIVASAPLVLWLVIGYTRNRGLSPRRYLGFFWPTWGQALGWAAAVLAVAFGLDWLTGRLGLEDSANWNFDAYRTALFLPLLYLAAVVFAPLEEEVLFRGFLLPGLAHTRLRAAGAVLVTAAAWTALHSYGAAGLAMIFCEGLILGAARVRTGSTYLAIGLHALLNLVAFTQIGWFLAHHGTEYYLERAREHLARHRAWMAVLDFQHAEEYAKGPCAECRLGMVEAYLAEREPGRAASEARRFLAARPSPASLERDGDRIGLALLRQRDADWRVLEAADDLLRRAADGHGPGAHLARVHLAEAELRLGRREEAAALAGQALALPLDWKAEGTARIVRCLARPGPPLPDSPLPGSFEPEGPPPTRAVATSPASPFDAAPPEDGPSRPGGGVERPQIIHREPPVYPEPARLARLQGTVILEAIIDEAGCVEEVKILKGLTPEMTAAAADAVRHWVFLPATYQGRPVKVYYSLTVNFEVR